MPFKRKLLIYAVGFLLGTGILSAISSYKKNKTDSPKSHFFCRSIYCKELQSTKPLDPFLALFYNEYPTQVPHVIKRILVFDRSGPTGFIRVEEEILQEPKSPEKLVSRLSFVGDHVQVRLKEDTKKEDLELFLKSKALTLIDDKNLLPNKNDNTTLIIKLPSCSIPAYEAIMNALQKSSFFDTVSRIAI